MKSIHSFYHIFSIFIVMFLFGCNKGETLDQIKDPISLQKSIEKIEFDGLSTISNPYTIDKHMTISDDADETKINEYLLDIAIAAREFLKESPMNNTILGKATVSANSCIAFSELMSNKGLNSKSSSFLNLEKVLRNVDLTHLSTNPLKPGEIEEYIPAIFVPNWETADVNKQPIISAGIEVNCELTGMEDYEDYIVAWYYDDNDKLQEMLIGEKFALNTSHPVFIIDNAEEEMTKLEKSVILPDESATLKSTQASLGIKTYEFQINYRYEGSGDSEFCITAAQIDENGTVHLVLQDGGYTLWKEISSVSKRNIGRAFTEWNQFCYNELYPPADNYVFWNTYERDWAKSDKSLGQATKNGSTIYLSGKRRYSSDWYGFDPSTLNDNPLAQLARPPLGIDHVLYSNSKGHLGFWLVVL